MFYSNENKFTKVKKQCKIKGYMYPLMYRMIKQHLPNGRLEHRGYLKNETRKKDHKMWKNIYEELSKMGKIEKNEQYAIYSFEFGKIRIGYNDHAITSIELISDHELEEDGIPTQLSNQVFTQFKEYFEGKRKVFDFPYELHGTEFQKNVWKALLHIPYGETRSYKDIAVEIGNPKAVRAVGNANNKNPILIAVPCHRVIGSNGKLVGYGGGIDKKEYLLELEKANTSHL